MSYQNIEVNLCEIEIEFYIQPLLEDLLAKHKFILLALMTTKEID